MTPDPVEEVPFDFEDPAPLSYDGDEELGLSAEDEFDEDEFEAALEQERLELGVIPFDPIRHPRALDGRFREVVGKVEIEGEHHEHTNVVGGHHKIKVGSDVAIGASKADAIEKARALKSKQRARREIAGKTSPEGLIERARKEILSGHPTTADKYSYTDPNTGDRIYDSSRKPVHDRIIDAFLRMDAEGNPCESCPRHQPPQDRAPEVFFSGGGFAAGKGRVVNTHEGRPPKAIVLDPDKIKAMLPEFQQLNAAKDPEANLRVYEEAWDVSQAIADQIQQEGLDVIVDGVGNTSSEEMLKRVQSYMDAGYQKPKAVYVTIPTDLAVQRAQSRAADALKTGKTESLRIIPEDLMRDVHGDVSKVFPEIAEQFPGEVELWDNRGDTPVQVGAKSATGKFEVLDDSLWRDFLDKAKDSKE